MACRLTRWSFSLMIVLILGIEMIPAQGSTGICALDCVTGFGACLGTTPGCTGTLQDCPDGTECRNGKCGAGGQRDCPVAWSLECSPCIEANGTCLQGCEGIFLPALELGIRRAGLDQGQERALLAKVEQVEKELATGLERAVESLEAFQKHVTMQAGKGIDQKTAVSLSELARRMAASLDGNGVAACVSAVTIVEEGAASMAVSGQKK